MTIEFKTSVAQLNGENYYMWKFQVEMLLIKESIRDVLNKETPEKDADSVHKDNDKGSQVNNICGGTINYT